MNLVKRAKSKEQGFSNVALLGSKPPPQMNQEHVVGLARERQTDNMLFYSFFWAGREHKCLAFGTIKSVLLAKQRR